MCENIKTISQCILNRVDKKFYTLMNNIALNLAYDFMFSSKYIISYEDDPPWDSSGRLVNLDMSFSLKDYSSVGDFLEEYTGQSRASYMSGCGLFHIQFEENYEHIVMEYIDDCLKEVLSEIGDEYLIEILHENGYEVSKEEEQDVIQTIMELEIFEEPLSYHMELFERIKTINFELMILRGREKAIKKYNDQMQRTIENQERINAEKQTAENRWSKLLQLHILQTGKDIQKIEVKDYKMFKQFLDANQVTKEDRIILVNHLNGFFSNKVCEYMSRDEFLP